MDGRVNHAYCFCFKTMLLYCSSVWSGKEKDLEEKETDFLNLQSSYDGFSSSFHIPSRTSFMHSVSIQICQIQFSCSPLYYPSIWFCLHLCSLNSIVHFILTPQTIPFTCSLTYSPELFLIKICRTDDFSILLHSTSCVLFEVVIVIFQTVDFFKINSSTLSSLYQYYPKVHHRSNDMNSMNAHPIL